MIADAWHWVIAHSDDALRFFGAIGLFTFLSTYAIERWKRGVARRRAAALMAKHLGEYVRHWVNTHWSNQNAQPDPDDRNQWPGAEFKLPLSTKEEMEAFGDLAPGLRNAVFNLHTLVQERHDFIQGVAEFRDYDLDDEGPIAVATIAVKAEEVFRRVSRSAGLASSEAWYDSAESIRGWLSRAERDWEAAQERQRKSAEQVIASASEKKEAVPRR